MAAAMGTSWHGDRGGLQRAGSRPRFSVGDGFKFGCGFTLALAIGGLTIVAVLSLLLLVTVLLGADLWGFLGRFR